MRENVFYDAKIPTKYLLLLNIMVNYVFPLKVCLKITPGTMIHEMDADCVKIILKVRLINCVF